MSDLTPSTKPELSPGQQIAFAKLLGMQRASAQAGDAIPLLSNRQSAPLSFAQQRMLVLQQMDPQSWLYNIPFATRLRGELNRKALERALSELVRRHEILRTTIEIGDLGVVQRIHPAREYTLTVSCLPDGSDVDASIYRFAEAEAREPFDLTADPVLRARLLQVAEDDHVFVMTIHHIFSDAWSNRLLTGELAALYAAYRDDQPSSLPKPALQYADYSAWLRSDLHQPIFLKQLAYWKNGLKDAPTAIDLPLLKGRPSEDVHAGDICKFLVDAEVTAKLGALASNQSATPFMALTAVLTAFLARYSGQTDILIGTPISGRTRLELESLPGLFTNTLVMRNTVAHDPSVSTLIAEARERALEAYDHQDVPFDMVVSELQLERDLTRHPLFQVFLLLQNAPSEPWSLAGLTSATVRVPSHTAKFDLSFSFMQDGPILRGAISFNTALFEKTFIERMAANLGLFLGDFVAHPNAAVSSLAVLSTGEAATLAAFAAPWTKNYAAMAEHRSGMHQFFEHQAALTPHRAAIDHHGEVVTYGELNARANHVAARIAQLGPPLSGESIVAVSLHRTPDLIAALIGVLKAGSAFVALDFLYPAPRIAAMLEDAKPALVITTAELSIHLPPTLPTILLDEPAQDVLPAVASRPVSSASAAYIIYTSGSTGKPKGILIEHGSVCTLLHWAREVWSSEELSGVLASTSICFDLSIFEIFAPLSWGGTVVLADNALELPDLVSRDRVRLVNTVPSAMTELLRIRGLPETVRVVNLAGEALSRKLVDQLQECASIDLVANLYGPSEDTTYSTCRAYRKDDSRPVSIGKPIANTQAFVLGSSLDFVPCGVTGELFLAGDGLARGYVRKPDLTAERFLPNPWGPPGARMYRTGDQARWRDDGTLDCLGRIDQQVKVRGFRIELEEIEMAMLRNPDMAQVAVIVREDRVGDKRLVAYFVAKDGHMVRERDLRSELARTLPAYMLPSTFAGLSAFPLTPNGKVDRKNFAAPTVRPQMKQTYRPPTDPLRWQLVMIWQDLLNIEPIGVHDNFFESGGDSLLAVQLIHRIQQVCGVRLPLAALFRHSTIETLSKAMMEVLSDSWTLPVVEIQAGDPSLKSPFFYLHGDFLSGGFYSVDLARYLPADQPFYILHPHGLDGGEIPQTIEEMAALHLEEMRRIQPKGPYFFGGKCGGSMIAFEMARLLQQADEEVGLLALVHGWPGARYLSFKRPLKPANRAPRAELLQSANYQTRKLWALYRYNWAIKTYLPESYSGKVTLFWPDGVALRSDDRTAGWSQVADEVEVHSIQGDSYTCITRHVSTLGRRLSEVLEGVHATLAVR